MMSNAIDILAVVVATLACWAVVAKKKSLNRVTGILMVASYFIYMVYVVMRETGMM
jgi:Ca2+/H+ antiporter